MHKQQPRQIDDWSPHWLFPTWVCVRSGDDVVQSWSDDYKRIALYPVWETTFALHSHAGLGKDFTKI